MHKIMKKIIPAAIASIAISCISMQPAFAQDAAGGAEGGGGGSVYLKIIAEKTTAILEKVNDLPDYIKAGTMFILAWTDKDDSDTTANMQGDFTTLSNSAKTNLGIRDGIQQTLLSDFFGPDITQDNFPGANDMVYQTLIGKPYFPETRKTKDGQPVDAGLNYIENASGVHIQHDTPKAGWGGSADNKKKYAAYYSAISSVQTYNAYAMSNVYADYKNKYAFSETQKSLIDKATSSDWFTEVSTEKIGIVLRQILMFDSQIFVVMSRLLDTQKQALTAQTMTNTLLILLNQSNEDIMVKKASGKMPGG